MATITGSVAGGNWSATTAWVGGVVPTVTDDVLLTATSGAIVIDGASGTPSSCHNLDCTGYLSTLSASLATRVLRIDGSLTLSTGMSVAGVGNFSLSFTSSSTGNTITTAGKQLPAITFNGSGSWQLQDNLAYGVTNSDITLTAGTLDTNGKNVGSSGTPIGLTSSNTNTRSLTLGTSTWFLKGTGIAWSIVVTTGMTLSAASSTLTAASGALCTFHGGGLTYGALTCTATAIDIYETNTFASITMTGAASLAAAINFRNDQVITGALTLNGANATTGRLLVRTNNKGITSVVTAASVSVSNADFQDITGAGAANWNLSAITGLSGDCGGNSGITFTTAINCYWVADTGSVGTASLWKTTSGGSTTARVPLPQDSAFFDANSFTTTTRVVTMNIARIGSVDFTGALNTPMLTWTVEFSIFGNLILIPAMTKSNIALRFEGRGTFNFEPAGFTFGAVNLSIDSGNGVGILKLSSAFNSSTTSLVLVSGTLDGNGFAIAATVVASSGGTIIISGGLTQTGTTLNIAAGVVDMANHNLSFTGSGALTVSGTGNLILGGVLTCNTLSLAGGTTTYSGGVFQVTTSINISAGTHGGSIANSGTCTITGGTFTLGSIGGTGTTFSQSAGTFNTSSSGLYALSTSWTITGGSFNEGGGGIRAPLFTLTGTGARSISMVGQWEVTGTGTVWNATTVTNLTFTRNSSTIYISNTSATSKVFTGGGLTYGTMSIAGAASMGAVTITANNRFAAITAVPDSSFLLQSSTTTTLDSPPMWVGTSGHNIIVSANAAAAATIATTGTPACDYLTLSRSTITGPSVSYAGANSTNGGTNTGWTFSAAPTVYNDSFTESVTGSDSLSATVTISTTMTETIASSDTLAVSATFIAAMTESIAASDSEVAGAVFRVTISESLTASDALAAALIVSVPLLASVAASDSVTGIVSYDYFFTESLIATDTIIGGLLFNATFTETVAASDALAVSNVITQAITETVEAEDTDTSQAGYTTAFTETVVASDIILGGVVTDDDFTETVTATDSMTSTKSYDYFITETIMASDSLASLAIFNASITASVSASDAMTVIGPKTIPDVTVSGVVLDIILLNGVW